MKNNISFYQHKVDSHNHWKFKTLRRKYGWCGEGKFWAFNNLIGDSENCLLDLSDENKKLEIAADLDFEVTELDEFIEFLCAKCKLIFFEDKKITTGMVQEVFTDVDTRRQKQKEFKRQKALLKTSVSLENKGKFTEKARVSTVENEQSKVKEKKVKESKVNKRIKPLVVSDETTNQQKELKKNYSEYSPTLEGKPRNELWTELKTWVLENKPDFIDPFVDLWNVFADKYKLSTVIAITENRKRKFETRIREQQFNFFEILKIIQQSAFLKGTGDDKTTWKVDFDFIMESEANYIKILEWKYK